MIYYYAAPRARAAPRVPPGAGERACVRRQFREVRVPQMPARLLPLLLGLGLLPPTAAVDLDPLCDERVTVLSSPDRSFKASCAQLAH